MSGDDLHLWERGDSNWKNYTHLNPDANDLNLGREHLKVLRSNNKIYRKKYNHDTGKFDTPSVIYPAKFIVYEGLHALYDSEVRDISWIKIFIETDEELKKEWKMKRDTEKRGYTKNEVEDAIARRKDDEDKYIKTQKQYADVIIRFKKEGNDVVLDFEVLQVKARKLVSILKEAYNKHLSFIEVCQSLSGDYDLVQSRGGNVSYKINDKLVITSSGSKMSDVTTFSGHCICNMHLLPSYFDNDDVYRNKLFKSKLFESGERPSMESGLHSNLEKGIIHTHPIYLNIILCSKEAKRIIGDLFSDLDYEFVPYSTPGVELSNVIGSYRQAPIYFLENHGLVVCDDDLHNALKWTKYIHKESKKWVEDSLENVEDLNDEKCLSYLFPDAVALGKENEEVNCNLMKKMYNVGLTPKVLSDDEIEKIQNMESEKYRSQLV